MTVAVGEATTWVFDVDGCIVDALSGSALRPLVIELLQRVRSLGCSTILWSAGGAAYGAQRAEQHGLTEFFDGFHGKEERDAEGRYRPTTFTVDIAASVFVDDRPEDVPLDAHVIGVAPYLSSNAHDRAFAAVLELLD